MIRVGIDISVLKNQSAFRGVGNYTSNLIKNLEEKKDIKVITGDYEDFSAKVDLVHFPFFDFFFYTLPLVKKKPTVVTIHDCIPLVFPKYYQAGLRGKIKFCLQKHSLRGVSAVITDSESSKRDILKYLNVPEKKVTVIYLAASNIFKPIRSTAILRHIAEKYNLPNKFILYVGDVNYNKNIQRLLEAFFKLDEEINLVLVGKSFENEELFEVSEIKNLIIKMSLEKRIKILGFVPTEDLVAIYNLAAVYCQPSLYEGFGLQIVEAMACGIPVVTGNISSMPEIGGEAAVLVDPADTESISEGLKKVLADGSFRDTKIKLGLEQAKKFSWEKTTLQTIEVYERILGK